MTIKKKVEDLWVGDKVLYTPDNEWLPVRTVVVLPSGMVRVQLTAKNNFYRVLTAPPGTLVDTQEIEESS